MENYLWSFVGVVMVAFFVRVYWDVLGAYLAYRRRVQGVEANGTLLDRHDVPLLPR